MFSPNVDFYFSAFMAHRRNGRGFHNLNPVCRFPFSNFWYYPLHLPLPQSQSNQNDLFVIQVVSCNFQARFPYRRIIIHGH